MKSTKTKYEFERITLNVDGAITYRSKIFSTLEDADKGKEHHNQCTFEEAEGKDHTHIMEFRDGEHYNDLYFINKSNSEKINIKEEEKKLINEMANFLHLAYCVEGSVEFDTLTDTETSEGKTIRNGILFKVVDKKRGTFYLGWYK